MVYGYARVSTREQNEARQLLALEEYGIGTGAIYLDKQSGKDFERPEYRRMLEAMKPGDVLVIKSIDRLGRNYDEILEQWRRIVKEKDCDIVVLDMQLLDTTKQDSGGLMGKVIADIVLQLLSYVAQTEREFIKQRQAEGIAAAKRRGLRFGRKPLERPEQYAEVLTKWQAGAMSATQAGEALDVCRNTFLKWARMDSEKGSKSGAKSVL